MRSMSERVDALVAQLRGIEETLRDLAYDRLSAATHGDENAAADERRFQQASRAVERAIHALGDEP
jgi:hypothetical protein